MQSTPSSASSEVVRSVTVRVPGSTSNIGPGFDSLGLAVTIYNTVRFDLLATNDSSVPLVTFESGESLPLPTDRTNHIFQVLERFWSADPAVLDRVRISIDCAVPIGSGLGSSGTATLAAAYAAKVLNGQDPALQSVLENATLIEGHPDNVSPSLLGGLTVSGTSHRKVFVQKLQWPEEWQLLFVVPSRQLKTSEARAALPKVVPFKDAVHNVQYVSLLLAAVANRDAEQFSYALQDKLHEPYRASLVPELLELKKTVRGSGALGCVLSGAGPTVMIVSHRAQVPEVQSVLEPFALQTKSRVLKLAVDAQGLTSLRAHNLQE